MARQAAPLSFSKAFKLGKSQAELDFVNVPVLADAPLFVDPYAISKAKGAWSARCHETLTQFFDRLINLIRAGKEAEAERLMRHLREPNETHLGLSKGRPQGAGIGQAQAVEIYDALRNSGAARTGFLQHLAECELWIPGVSHDKISDLTTNVIRGLLIEYTEDQCNSLGITTRQVRLPPVYDPDTGDWVSQYANCPVYKRRYPILLVPKIIVRSSPAFDHHKYYNRYVLEYLQAEEFSAGSSLVRTLKSGAKRPPTKKALREKYPLDKEWLFQFSQQHQGVLDKYRKDRPIQDELGAGEHLPDPAMDAAIAKRLRETLPSIPGGRADADGYHNHMMGVLEFLFFPHLLHPKKEAPIHEGRKRIDIIMTNGASSGVFWWLHEKYGEPCPYVVFECKNYQNAFREEPGVDQLQGRFSVQRGKVGFICCRVLQDREAAIKRCRDARVLWQGIIVPLDDATVSRMLLAVEAGQREAIDRVVQVLVDEGLFNVKLKRVRTPVLAAWGDRCAVTGVRTLDAVRASHIKPWRDSEDEERLDPANGLPLVATLDALFDAGLISFEDTGDMLTSALLDEAERGLLGLTGLALSTAPSPATASYLVHHRNQVLRS